MFKILIFFAIQAFVICDWSGKWQVSFASSVNYGVCDLPPLSSTVMISTNPAGNLTFTRYSQVLNMSVTQPLGWSSTQKNGSACYPAFDYCIDGELRSSSATLYWYSPDLESQGCQIELTPILPSWIGQWLVTGSKEMDYCPVPGVNSQVTIKNGVTGLTMTGIDSVTLEKRTWNLNWTPTQQNINTICFDYLCTTASLNSEDDTLTASISWVENTIYKCYVTLTQSQDESDDLFLSI